MDSGIDTEYASDMESISSSTYEHRYGKRRFWFLQPHALIRRYHGVVSNPYPMPNDEMEKERLDELQYCFRKLIGANVVAPIRSKPTQIGKPVYRRDSSRSGCRNRFWNVGYGGSGPIPHCSRLWVGSLAYSGHKSSSKCLLLSPGFDQRFRFWRRKHRFGALKVISPLDSLLIQIDERRGYFPTMAGIPKRYLPNLEA